MEQFQYKNIGLPQYFVTRYHFLFTALLTETFVHRIRSRYEYPHASTARDGSFLVHLRIRKGRLMGGHQG